MARVLKPQQQFPIDWCSIELHQPEYILVFDQSLVNTGWALVLFESGATPFVVDYGTIHTAPIKGLAGFEDSFVRGEKLFEQLRSMIADVYSVHDVTMVLHETPSLMTFGGQSKGEAAPVAAMMVRIAVRSTLPAMPIEMLQAQVVQSWIGGRRGATKAEVHAEMWKMIPEFKTNEHVRDAVAIALTYVARRDLDRRVEAWRAAR